MSAFMCTRKTILVVAVFSEGSVNDIRRRLREDENGVLMAINAAARVFHRANTASLESLYGGRRELDLVSPESAFPAATTVACDAARRLTAEGKTLRREVLEILDLPLATLFSTCRCFHYQACEAKDYTQQPWFAEYTYALHHLIESVPGMDAAPWGI